MLIEKLEQELRRYLVEKYKKEIFSAAEVAHETLSEPSKVPSTAGREGFWRIDDIVRFINQPSFVKKLEKMKQAPQEG